MTKKLICNQVSDCEFGKYCICARPFIDTGLTCKFRSDVTFIPVDIKNEPELTDREILVKFFNAGGVFNGVTITDDGDVTSYQIDEGALIQFIRGYYEFN